MVLGDMPVVNGQLLDLVALLGTITKRGGVRRVQDQNLWNEVGGGIRRSAHCSQPRRPQLNKSLFPLKLQADSNPKQQLQPAVRSTYCCVQYHHFPAFPSPRATIC